ncbi:hypothetical protein AMECASPLE_012298 [Ameca splendens]|uniref:Uncharacterized protein n=1 Tax=Ameca splendens TaxID=208324 RepID=A0ABV0ZC80_9TELE
MTSRHKTQNCYISYKESHRDTKLSGIDPYEALNNIQYSMVKCWSNADIIKARPLRTGSVMFSFRWSIFDPLHDHGSMPNMLTQSIDDITLSLPTKKQVSVASIRKVRFTPNCI